MNRTISSVRPLFCCFQLRRDPQAVLGDMAPSSHALRRACLLGPAATARRLGAIKLCNGDRPHTGRSAVRVTLSRTLTTYLNKSSEASDIVNLFLPRRVQRDSSHRGNPCRTGFSIPSAEYRWSWRSRWSSCSCACRPPSSGVLSQDRCPQTRRKPRPDGPGIWTGDLIRDGEGDDGG